MFGIDCFADEVYSLLVVAAPPLMPPYLGIKNAIPGSPKWRK
jgi:hypothetical protein